MGYGWNYSRKQVEDEAWKCKTCGMMVTYGHICKVREVVKCPDCGTMCEKGQEDLHYRRCPVRRSRVKVERAKAAKERREERKASGKVGYVHMLPEKELMIFMEPGSRESEMWVEVEIEKNPWKCKICGLVWQTREDAERCPLVVENPFVPAKMPHAHMYQRMYGIRYVENGVPRGNPHTIDFKAMRQEEPVPLPEGKKWDIPEVKPYGVGQTVRNERKKLMDIHESVEGENPDPDVSEYPNLSTAEMDEGDYP